MLNLSSDTKVTIDEYPKIYDSDFSMLSTLFKGEKKINISNELIPHEAMDQIDILDILPILYSDDMLMILPYKIETQ